MHARPGMERITAPMTKQLYASRHTGRGHLQQPWYRTCAVAKTPALILFGVMASGGETRSSSTFATILLVSLLWLGLYELNEISDIACEQARSVPLWRWSSVSLWTLGLCIAAYSLSTGLGTICTLMLVGQYLYSLPLLRMKRLWWYVVVVSGITNPLLRVACGAIHGQHSISPIAWATVVALHLGAALRTRTLQSSRDRELGYSTVPSLAACSMGVASCAIGLIGICVLTVIGVLPLWGFALAVMGGWVTALVWSPHRKDMDTLRKRGWLALAAALMILSIMLGTGH